jgi:hypothetical protein
VCCVTCFSVCIRHCVRSSTTSLRQVFRNQYSYLKKKSRSSGPLDLRDHTLVLLPHFLIETVPVREMSERGMVLEIESIRL